MNYKLLSMLVSNHFGVLTRVTNLFSRRGFNIKELTVGETDDPNISRITILTEGDELLLEQIQKQLLKLEDVIKAVVLPQDDNVSRELLLIKVACDKDRLEQIKDQVEKNNAKIVNVNDRNVIIEATGETSEIDSLINLMKKHGIMEMCRTGVTALQSGQKTIYDK